MQRNNLSPPFLQRAVFLFRETSSQALIATIESFGATKTQVAGGSIWVYSSEAEPLLSFQVISDISAWEIDLTANAFDQWWQPLKSELGVEPDVALLVQVSAGHLARTALRRFAVVALEAHEGIAQDDNKITLRSNETITNTPFG